MVNTLCGQKFEKGSEEKGGSLSEKNCLGVPYLEMGLVGIISGCQRSLNEFCK